jgi:molybdopterin-guanine dinucleotide biosynthesis protein A
MIPKDKTNLAKPIGLILCGGKSERMTSDKAFIDYHGMPQWQYVHQLLQPFCEEVYLSLNAHQASEWSLPSNIHITIDKEPFTNHGPMTALLSALELVKGRPLFIVACDYPLLEKTHLRQLLDARTTNSEITCFSIGGLPEPLISIFETAALKNLTSFFANGSDSIFKFIEQCNSTYIEVEDSAFLKNVNSEADMELMKKKLDL